MDDLLRDFLVESGENLASLDNELVVLEQNPNDINLISSIFRLVHTIKGTCGFIGLPRLEKLAHAAENILGKFRDRELEVTPVAVTLILRCIDAIKSMLAYLEQNGQEREGDDAELINDLNALAEGRGGEIKSSSGETSGGVTPVHESPDAMQPDEHGFVPVRAGDIKSLQQNMVTTKPNPQEKIHAQPQSPKSAASGSGQQQEQAEAVKGGSVADQSIRVDVGLLEKLMTIVSELVLTRNQLLQILRMQKDTAFTAPLQRLNQVTSELQDGVMKTRMQQIGMAWSKLPRIIRDLSLELGKKIELQMFGAETELDRQVLEMIKDPLTHMVRNSADHGIEMPADRLKVGKPETGTVMLNAYHEGGHIVIEISDDGRGLAINKIRSKAVEKGLATEAELSTMSDQQIMQFIFRPGFSTAAQVTSVSGRGVGMDVVKTNIERIGGTVDLQSVEGKGSTFLIKIPLTLAIVSALIVECLGDRFAIPQISVVELVKASPESDHRIEMINATPVLRLRNRLLPLVSLRKTLKLGEDDTAHHGHAFIVVIQAANTVFGIIVDKVFDTEEIVVKPVSPILRAIDTFSRNIILGDGSVIMILDLNSLVLHAGNIHDSQSAMQAVAQSHVQHTDGTQSLLIFRAGDGAPKAVPLSLVARLEEVDRKSIEYSDGSPVIQYRGALMPLVPINPGLIIPTEGLQPVLVFSDGDKSMGLLVDEIIDIVEDRLHADLTGHKPGFLGTSIVDGKATDIIDAAYFLSQAFESWFSSEGEAGSDVDAGRKILLVDDSPFFRNLLTPLLSVAGYDVTTVQNPIEALKLYETGADFDAIVSDIEMPEMSGFEFATKIRQSGGRWSNLPIFAMSSHATRRDLDRGRQAGFTDYVAKFNRDALLEVLQQSLKNHEVSNEQR